MKFAPNLEHEALLWKQGSAFVFGIDEAGRGCLAGPVCAAVYSLPANLETPPVNIRDSKQIKEEERERILDEVKSAARVFGVGLASSLEIDKYNILQATCLAILRATEMALAQLDNFQRIAFLTDGGMKLLHRGEAFLRMPEFAHEFSLVRKLFQIGFSELPVVKGDGKVVSIAGASVIAKVTRDRVMRDLALAYPQYEFEIHKGYSTPRHVSCLNEHGPCSEHRMSFAPVRSAASVQRV